MPTLRDIAVQRGLEPPLSEASTYFCTCGHTHAKRASHSPTLTEMALAAKPHRWKKMRDEQRATFTDFMDRVTKAETDLFRALRLPDIDKVRHAVLTGKRGDSGVVTLDRAKEQAISRIFDEWAVDLVGHKGQYKVFLGKDSTDETPILEWHALRANAIGLEKTHDLIVQEYKVAYGVDFSDTGINLGIYPDPDERYLKAMLNDGAKRIAERVSVEKKAKVLKVVRQAVKDGMWPIDLGVTLHDLVGEGEAWWWLRLARSECVLANNAAFNAMADAAGVKYESWSAAPNACDVCYYLNGRTWRRGEGPEPVSSTHPHCLCARIPLFLPPKTIEKRWSRDPYAQPFTAEEFQMMREGILG